MGLACPVCDVPHPDGEHLADHVAITATIRDGDHRAWLDEHAPDWQSMIRHELGALVVDHAEEVDSIDLHEEIERHRTFERHESHEEPRAHRQDVLDGHAATDPLASLDEEARAIITEAQAMAQQKRADDGDDEKNGTVERNGTDP